MNARSAAAVVVCLATYLAACPKRETPTTDMPSVQTGGGEQRVSTSSDPWAQARKIAETAGVSGLEKWRDDVPYLFQGRGTRGVLVHHGAVVTARGPAAAGAYLRDVGILDGKGPSPRSILTLLFVLRAFPVIDGLPEESAFDMQGPVEYRPRVELANGHARVLLFYRMPSNNPGPYRGTAPMMREILDIGPTGDASWTGEPFDAPLP